MYFSMVVACEDNQLTTNGLDLANGATGWELALVTAPSSNESAVTSSKLVSSCNLISIPSTCSLHWILWLNKYGKDFMSVFLNQSGPVFSHWCFICGWSSMNWMKIMRIKANAE